MPPEEQIVSAIVEAVRQSNDQTQWTAMTLATTLAATLGGMMLAYVRKIHQEIKQIRDTSMQAQREMGQVLAMQSGMEGRLSRVERLLDYPTTTLKGG
jgi:hypothetical protein